MEQTIIFPEGHPLYGQEASAPATSATFQSKRANVIIERSLQECGNFFIPDTEQYASITDEQREQMLEYRASLVAARESEVFQSGNLTEVVLPKKPFAFGVLTDEYVQNDLILTLSMKK